MSGRGRAVGATAALWLTIILLPAQGSPANAPVIVRGARGAADAAVAVRRAGGRVERALPIVDGVSARVPTRALAGLAHDPLVRGVTPNERVSVAASPSTGSNPSTIKSVFALETKADLLWAQGIDGSGIRVALIDTGVTKVADLAGRVIDAPDPTTQGHFVECVNFSGEQTCDDTYGHGTFVAGLIAGNGALSNGAYKGIAPGAQIVSVKIAGADGSADVSKVLAAIQYVVSFSSAMNIRILNLSLGTNGHVSYRFDPLNFAVERAWQKGIAVVVSAGNVGPNAGTISKPADDPLVITTGAVDDRETPAISDDRLPFFSSVGPTTAGQPVPDLLAKPDVVAPGGRVVSLRAPGSTIDAMLAARGLPGVDANYRRGSGTSMSAAIVSGAAALVLQANPGWLAQSPARYAPDRLKFALVSTAHKVAVDDPMKIGAGLIDAYGAARLAPPGLANTDVTVLSDASGSIEDSRGDLHVRRPCTPVEKALNPDTCGIITGGETAQGHSFDAQHYANDEWNDTTWYAGQWRPLLFGDWTGSSWYGSDWKGSSWYGSSWYGNDEGDTFYGASVQGSSWYGAWD